MLGRRDDHRRSASPYGARPNGEDGDQHPIPLSARAAKHRGFRWVVVLALMLVSLGGGVKAA